MSDSPQGKAPAGVQELLAHRRFLRLLASNLVRDEHRAEDLVQDTWLRALENPPQHTDPQEEGRLRGWLGRVLRNRAINEGQREAQRGERERDASLGDVGPGLGEVEAELEAQRQVVENLQTLREPYRSTLYLRYYRELGPSKIAELQGVPVKTVKTRLSRGLEEMRQAMDRGADGDRSSWALLLMPLVRGGDLPLDPIGTQLSIAQSGSGALGIKLALGAASLMILGAGLRYGSAWISEPTLGLPGDSQLTDSGEAPDQRTKLVRAEPLGEPLRNVIQAESVPLQSAALSSSTLRGRVVDYGGEPIALASLSLRTLRTNSTDSPDPVGLRTDAQGQFEIEAPWLGQLGLKIQSPGFANAQWTLLGLGRDQELGDLRLDRGAELYGRVLDDVGFPISGAHVEARSGFGRPGGRRGDSQDFVVTDSEGHFRLTGQALGPWELRIAADGFLVTDAAGIVDELMVSGNGTWIGELELAAGEALRGRVGRLPAQWSTEEGMQQLEVRARLGERTLSCGLDALGSFELGGLPAGEEITLNLTVSDGQRTASLARASGMAGDELIVLDWNGAEPRWFSKSRRPLTGDSGQASGSLEVLVNSASGEALVGALVSQRRAETNGQAADEFRVTDALGRARWDELAPGDYRVRLIQAGGPGLTTFGRLAAGAQELASVQSDQPTSVELRAHSLQSLQGQVLQEGLALPGAVLSLRPAEGRGESYAARADSEGRFHWESLSAGEYRLSVQHISRFLDTTFHVTVGSNSQQQIFELYSATLVGRVLDSAGQPLEGVRLEPRAERRSPFRRGFEAGFGADAVFSDDEGFFTLRGLEPGQLLAIDAHAPGYVRETSLPLELVAGEERRGLQFVLRPGADLKVELKGQRGTAVGRRMGRPSYYLHVTGILEGGEEVEFDGESTRGRSLELNGLSPGIYWVQVFKRGKLASTELGEAQRVVLDAGASVELVMPI
ncbi:MAG: RNA polymerase sigma-70 factor (ECF subfamily) [Candidatus Paceibacteria bacterium]|jgi:RNA polymerase sigma-70 factor (ECF subfamily)